MNKRAKKQHYISSTYLEGFSSPTKKKNLLYVWDIKRKYWRSSRPENEGFERDFQSLIDENGNKSDALEAYFAPFEGEFKNIIRQIENTRCFPKGPEQIGTFLSIMGLFAIRIPRVRECFIQHATDVMKKNLGLILKDKATYYALTEKAYKDGYLKENPVSYEQMLTFYQSDKYSIKHDPMWMLGILFKNAATITDYLHLRNWMIVEAPSPLFITSSKPVNPLWTISLPPHLRGKNLFFDPKSFHSHSTISACYMPYNEVTDMFPSFLPGFGHPRSIIVFPLTPYFTLIGSWSPLPNFSKIDYSTAQAINWVTANSAADYIYSPQKLEPLPWKSIFVPYLQDYHNQLGSRLITFKP